MINVYYEQMFYHNITEKPNLTVESIICIIRGNFFLGMSILSFIEFFEILYIFKLFGEQIVTNLYNTVNIYKIKETK